MLRRRGFRPKPWPPDLPFPPAFDEARQEALARLWDHGVGLSLTPHPTRLRAVTHLDVGDDDIEQAVELIPRALGALARA